VLSIEDVTEKFNATSKTIQRWRRRGLPARRFVYPDGKKRVGFLLSSVERFVQIHRDQVERGANFSQVNDAEKAEIVRRARRLATMCHCCVNEISRRIARRLNRSPLTVLHTIRKFDADHPEHAVFARAPQPLEEAERVKILKAHRLGVSMRTLARRSCRPRSAIYRVIVDERIARLNRRKVRFLDDPIYHGDDAATAINAMVSGEDIRHVPDAEATRIPRDLPPYLQELYRTPLLTPAKERALFLKFNFHKYQFVQARRRLDPQFARAKDLNVLEGHLRRATETKNAIVRANLRLVVSVARKHVRSNVPLMELVSDGNMTLLRAVESFDVHKGNRFSTYATLALMKGFARTVPLLQSRSKHAKVETLAVDVADASSERSKEIVTQRDEVRQLLRRLDARERAVVEAHFGLGQSEAMTYDALATQMGLSKQRIRQIEQRAIEKLRASMS
jgi:RNA polymerase sigma factor (sigma-70 family)